jgi:protein TonB
LQHAQAALSKHLFYPPAAVEQGLEGDVVLLLALDENGRILTAEIATSSGHALLDQAALDAARQIGALPGNPRQTLLPVSFRLQ